VHASSVPGVNMAASADLSFRPDLWPDPVARLADGPSDPVDILFDMDGTLLDGDIGDALVGWLMERGHHPEPFATRAPDFDTYFEVTRGWEREDQSVLCARIIVGLTPAELDAQVDACRRARVPWRKPVLALARKLHALGHRVWILTGSAEPLARVVARAAGLDPDRCIGIRLARDAQTGRYTERIVPPVSFGVGKVVAARTRLGRSPGLALGDSLSDLHILRTARVGVAVPPAVGRLTAVAAAAGVHVRLPDQLGG